MGEREKKGPSSLVTMSYRRNSRGWLLSSQTLEGPKERGWCLLPQWLLLQQEGAGPREGTWEVGATQTVCLLVGK